MGSDIPHEVAYSALEMARGAMLSKQIEARGITNERVISAMSEIPRHLFVKPHDPAQAYADKALDIGFNQTISQPYIVALMSSLLADLPVGSRILEIGAGSGYQTAVLVHMGFEVHSMELIPQLRQKALEILSEQDLSPASMVNGDGRRGMPEKAPFDAIISAARSRRLPHSWVNQLSEAGIIVAPLGGRFRQRLIECRKEGSKLLRIDHCEVRFVPLLRG